MTKITDARITALKALFETNDTISQTNLWNFIDALQEAAQEHEHTPTGGPGSGTGDAAAISYTDTLFVPPAVPTSGTWASALYHSVVQLADGNNEGVLFTFKAPARMLTFTKVELVWNCAAAAGNLNWTAAAQYGSAGEAPATHGQVRSAQITATAGANLLNVQEHNTPFTLTGIVAADYVGIAVTRRADLPADTLGATVNIFGLLFTYVAQL